MTDLLRGELTVINTPYVVHTWHT